MTNTITNRQMFFILVLTLTSYSSVVIAKEMAQSAGTGGWTTILVTALVFAATSACIVKLNTMFEEKMVFEYAPSLISKPGAYLLGFYFALYFLFILVFLVTGLSKLLGEDFLPKSPVWSFPLVGLPVFCYVAYKGVTNVARLAEMVGVVFLVTAVLVHILIVSEGRVNRILPLFNPAEIGNYISGFQYSIFPFLGIETLLVLPVTRKNSRKSAKTAFMTLITIGIFYVLVVESTIMKLGLHDIVKYNDALIVAIRDTAPQGFEIIARLDILYLTIGFGGLFLGICIVMLATVEFLCRIFKKTSRLAVVIVVGILSYAFFLIVIGIKGYEKFAETLGTYLGIFSAMVIPITLLIIAKVKKRKSGGTSHAG